MKIDWTTVFAAIGAVSASIGAVAAVGTLIINMRKAKRDQESGTAALWSMTVDYDREGQLLARLHYDMDGPPIRLLTLRARSPFATRLQLCAQRNEIVGGDGATRIQTVPRGQARQTVEISKDLAGHAIAAGMTIVLVHLPLRATWLRRSSTRLRISVKAEERTAMRRQSTIVVTSAQIPWTARQAASAT